MSKERENATKKNDDIRKLINGSAEIAGAAVGGALGFFAGGPIGSDCQ